VAEARDFALLQNLKTSSVVHQNSYSIGTEGKVAEAWDWPLTSFYFRSWEWLELKLCLPYMPLWCAQEETCFF